MPIYDYHHNSKTGFSYKIQETYPLCVECIGVNGPSISVICSGCSIDMFNFKRRPVVLSTFDSCSFLIDSPVINQFWVSNFSNDFTNLLIVYFFNHLEHKFWV